MTPYIEPVVRLDMTAEQTAAWDDVHRWDLGERPLLQVHTLEYGGRTYAVPAGKGFHRRWRVSYGPVYRWQEHEWRRTAEEEWPQLYGAVATLRRGERAAAKAMAKAQKHARQEFVCGLILRAACATPLGIDAATKQAMQAGIPFHAARAIFKELGLGRKQRAHHVAEVETAPEA